MRDFYVSFIALILALTGLTWGFEWFKEAVHKAAGGEKSLVYSKPPSDTTALSAAGRAEIIPAGANAVDVMWKKMQMRYPAAESIEIHFPESALSSMWQSTLMPPLTGR